ncbi:MAG: hypothetical protein ACI91B_003245 [Planctomycetota bacterium]|jgi:hypothetical protein
MSTSSLRLFAFVSLAQLFGLAAARAQDVRELTAPVADITLTSALVSTISTQASASYRGIDLEWVGTNGAGNPLFDAELVQNIGPYASGWWWYYGMTGTQLSAQITANQGRLIDIEPYETASGLRFACVMVPNTGANAKAWWYDYNSSVQGISNAAAANNARIVDVQRRWCTKRIRPAAPPLPCSQASIGCETGRPSWSMRFKIWQAISASTFMALG